MRTPEHKAERKREIMEKCYECYCDNGLRNTGIKELARYCGMTSANLYAYFDSVDDLIVQSTAYCMAKVEDDFMELAPKNPEDILRFIKSRQEISPDVSGVYASEIYRTRQDVFRGGKQKVHGIRKPPFAGTRHTGRRAFGIHIYIRTCGGALRTFRR